MPHTELATRTRAAVERLSDDLAGAPDDTPVTVRAGDVRAVLGDAVLARLELDAALTDVIARAAAAQHRTAAAA